MSAQNVEVKLIFKRDNGKDLIGLDEDGVERWFSKSKFPEYKIAGEQLVVMVPEKVWGARKKKSITENKAPANITAKGGRIRACLMCKEVQFLEKGMFVCDCCKESHAWKTANNAIGGVF